MRASRRLNDRDGHLGRIVQIAAVPAATAAATATLNPASTNMKHDDDDAAEVPTTPVKMSAAAAASNQHQDCSCLYNVEWVLGGKTMGVRRSDLAWTSAESEGFLQSTNAVENSRRDKRKPINFMEETRTKDLAKKQKQRESKLAATCSATGKNAKNAAPKRPQHQQSKPMKVNRRQPAAKAKPKAATASNKRKSSDLVKTAAAAPKGSKKQKLQQQQNETTATKTATPEETTSIEKLDLFEKHKREFERLILRLEKMDCYRHFVTAALEWEDATNNNKDNLDACPEQCTKEPTIPSASASDEIITDVENNNPCSPTTTTHCGEEGQKGETRSATLAMKSTSSPPNSALLEGSFSLAMPNQDTTNANGSSTFVTVPPCDWKSIRRRMEQGYYVVDRKLREENRRLELFAPYLESLGSKKSKRWKKEKTAKPSAATIVDFRVLYPHGIEWRLFQLDIFAMCDAAVARLGSDGKEEDDGQRGSLSYTVKRLKEAVQQVVERTGSRQETELDFADDRHKFALAVKASNTEAAMQSWRKIPFPERRYERTTTDVVCAGLSEVDEKIAAFELQTSLPDSFVGQSYRYDDTGQSEAWMKSVVDETGSGNKKTKKKNDQNDSDERLAALALIADEGVTQAQVAATMQSLLIAVQDKVMTEAGVLRQSELRSANWVAECQQQKSQSSLIGEAGEISLDQRIRESIDPTTLMPEIVEKPVWGIDCYTRRNILNCLGIEFDPRTSLLFVEKWLLPAINACPANLGHNIDNAARILEGLPFEKANAVEDECHENVEGIFASEYNESLLLNALRKKIKSSGPPWLQATANQLRRARAVLGEDFFRVHPKGHGSVVLSPTLKANALVTFYHGELYPSWRWGEKMDAIEITQKRKDLKP